jgi:FixJ family two-component response regulator
MAGALPRIIVVEDDASMSQAVERILRAGGYAATLFDSAEAALESEESAPADCLILDIHLPGMSGFELMRHGVLGGTEAPAIFITAYDDARARVEANRLGARGLLVKPFSGRALLEAVSEALQAD